MTELIEALTIFQKYHRLNGYGETYPIHAEHDALYICGVTDEEVSEEDIQRLDELGFSWSEEDDSFMRFT